MTTRLNESGSDELRQRTIVINKYSGWYEGNVDGFKDMLHKFHQRAEQMGGGDRPVLMTEFGGAGIFGDVGWEPRLFSEDYQAQIVTEALAIFRDDQRLAAPLSGSSPIPVVI